MALKTLIGMFLLVVTLHAEEAKLNILSTNGGVIMVITGGTNNVQYQVWTSANNNLSDTNSWYYWRRAYPNTEIPVTTTNTPWRTNGFFQIRGILPD